MAPKYMVLHLPKKAVSPQKNFFLKKKKKKSPVVEFMVPKHCYSW